MIWNRLYEIEELNDSPQQHLATLLGIYFSEITDNSLTAIMPVDERTRQPFGILHGGASVVLAETVGSVASNLVCDDNFMGVGLEVNANHLRPVKDGYVKAVCTPIHMGTKTHVWDIRIYDSTGKMNCISRLTVAILPKTGAKSQE
ncbi:hotdog fold thioesterase [Olivibacter sitiensis]|uniref:hotdog fold thioesterase n=1 Tax=Olivibacter sitiensis TaxID=376470 RepID=UPI00040F7E95|nr:hotdog fold thioesterase [Olivibacter sitiensis]